MRTRLRMAGLFATRQLRDVGYINLRSFHRTAREYVTVLSLLLCILLCSTPSSAQDLVWAKKAGGTSSDLGGSGIAVDTSGNSYVTGGFQGSATFGAGELNQTTLVSAGDNDVFVAKYDSNGMLVWAKRAGGTSSDLVIGIAVDTSGNSYVTGAFQGSATFGAGELNQTTLVSAGGNDVFVARYDSNGMLVWAKRAGGTQLLDLGRGIAVDTSGNSYVTGEFQGSATFGAGELNQTTLVSAVFSDIFVAKYDSSGMLVWAKQAGGTSDDRGRSIGLDTSGNSYVTGAFQGSATFGAGELNQTTLVSLGSDDIFVARYDSNGTLVWAKQAGGTSADDSRGIAVDTSGNSYVTGHFASSATFGVGELNQTTLVSLGSDDIFVARYDSNGMLVWAKQAGGTSTDLSRGIAVDTSGNSYVTGFFTGSATFGAGDTNQTTLVSAGSGDIFVARYDSNGMLVWAKRAGGTSSDMGVGIAVDASGNSYVTGSFTGSATFGAGDTNQTTLVSAGSGDIFVAKYATAQQACVASPAGPVSFWPGDGNATDIQNGNNGTLMNGATFAPGVIGNAFSFDGVDDFVQVPDSDLWAFGSSDFTINLWANFRSIAAGPSVLVGNDEGPGSTNKWLFVWSPSGGER